MKCILRTSEEMVDQSKLQVLILEPGEASQVRQGSMQPKEMGMREEEILLSTLMMLLGTTSQ